MSRTIINDNNTSIVTPPPEYSLKYDEKAEGLRDKTYIELNKEYNTKQIKCPCTEKIYTISSQWAKSHFSTQKHSLWRKEHQEEHIKIYGHCSSSEHIIDVLTKDLRSLKCNVSYLTNDKKKLLCEIERLKNEISKLIAENTKLKCEEVDSEEFVDCA